MITYQRRERISSRLKAYAMSNPSWLIQIIQFRKNTHTLTYTIHNTTPLNKTTFHSRGCPAQYRDTEVPETTIKILVADKLESLQPLKWKKGSHCLQSLVSYHLRFSRRKFFAIKLAVS